MLSAPASGAAEQPERGTSVGCLPSPARLGSAGYLSMRPGLSTLRNRSHHLVVTALPYAVGAALPENAGITSSANRRSERSAWSCGNVPQANAQST